MTPKTEVIPLYEGTFSVGTDKIFHRINREEPARKGALRIALNPFLIRHNGVAMLLDTGLGDFGAESHIPVTIENLQNHGAEPDDIRHIFLSHLHFDHIGGMATRENGFWELVYPQATIYLSRKEWDKLHRIGIEEPDREQYLQFLEVHANLHFVDDGDSPLEGVRCTCIGGHTEFSLAWFFDFGEKHRYLNAGDVMNTKGALSRKYAAKYDFDGKASQRKRDELIDYARQHGYKILAYHDNRENIIEV
ncbi:MAG: Metal-dependent hydrolases of the beta-lactamase superfamily II [Bacteroidetes bacterium HLUCCA01]|nr:MAG: Metal-dependent hydrolases of the beta-lactamase superfamily II [Bacteroidetes bacterium HLUCCA01]